MPRKRVRRGKKTIYELTGDFAKALERFQEASRADLGGDRPPPRHQRRQPVAVAAGRPAQHAPPPRSPGTRRLHGPGSSAPKGEDAEITRQSALFFLVFLPTAQYTLVVVPRRLHTPKGITRLKSPEGTTGA